MLGASKWGLMVNPVAGDCSLSSDVKLIIRSDDADGSTTFTDSSAGGHSISRVNVAHETDQAKIGGSSILTTAVGDELSVANHSDFDIDKGDAFTMEAWVYVPSGNAAYRYIFSKGGGAPGFVMQIGSDEKVYCQIGTTGSGGQRVLFGGISISTDQWVHIAWTYDGITHTRSGMKVFIGGVDTADVDGGDNTWGTSSSNSSALKICRTDSGSSSALYIDQPMFTRAVRYTTGFTPSTGLCYE
jgi:hypothetical protein